MNHGNKLINGALCLLLLVSILMVPARVSAADYSCTAMIPVEVQNSGTNTPSGISNSFKIIADDPGTPMPAVTEIKITDSGAADFGPIKYTVPGDYTYKVTQNAGTEQYFSYDSTTYNVTVRVTNSDDYKSLKAQVWAVKNDKIGKSNTLTFVNSYNPPVEQKATIETAVKSTSVKTNDSAAPFLWIALLAGSAACAIGIICERNRKKNVK